MLIKKMISFIASYKSALIPRLVHGVIMLLVLTTAQAQETDDGRGPDLSGNWNAIGAFGGFDPNPYAPTPLNEAGLALRTKYNDETMNPVYSCIGPGVPNVLIVPYMLAIDQTESAVTLHHEYFDTVRTVHLNQTDHPENIQPTRYGYSIGYYEGETLVVDTRNFSFDIIGSDMGGGPSSDQKRVVERYKRHKDNDILTVEFIIEDPVYLSEPYIRKREYRYAPEMELYEFECDPEFAGKTREMYQDPD